jgi:hypothetical protein
MNPMQWPPQRLLPYHQSPKALAHLLRTSPSLLAHVQEIPSHLDIWSKKKDRKKKKERKEKRRRKKKKKKKKKKEEEKYSPDVLTRLFPQFQQQKVPFSIYRIKQLLCSIFLFD